MRCRGWVPWGVGCLVLATGVQALALEEYGREPMTFASTPPGPYRITAPGTFEVVVSRHTFRGSQLPRVAASKPSVLIRRYDAQLGVYVDERVTDREPRPQAP